MADIADGRVLSDLFTFYHLPAGRMAFAARRVAALVESGDFDLPRVLAAANRADEAATELQTLTLRRRGFVSGSKARYSPETRSLDEQLDRLLTAIHSNIVSQRDGLGERSLWGTHAQQILDAIFPVDVNTLTSMSYTEFAVALPRIVEQLDDDGELAKSVATLNLGVMVQRLASLADRFCQAVERESSTVNGPTADDVRQARAHALELFAGLVATIIGTFPGVDPEAVEKRAALLAPIVTENETLRRQYRRHQSIEDVDPSTGRLLDDAPSEGGTPSDVATEG